MHLSYSQINTYLTCPRKYKYQYVDGIKPWANKQMLEGIKEHENASKEIPGFFKKAFEYNFPDPVFEEWLEKDYISFRLVGRIDVYSVFGMSASILDWKTFKVPDNDIQLKIYCLLLKEKYKDVEDFTCFFVSIKGGFYKRFSYTGSDIEKFEDELISIASDIVTEKEFKPLYGEWCAWCPFIQGCYEQAGIDIAKKIMSIRTLEEAVDLSKKVVMADQFLKQVKEKLKEFMLEQGVEEIDCGDFKAYLSTSVSLRFGKGPRKSK